MNGASLDFVVTYVRTEVNYTEDVDDPIDSDGEDSLLPSRCNTEL